MKSLLTLSRAWTPPDPNAKGKKATAHCNTHKRATHVTQRKSQTQHESTIPGISRANLETRFAKRKCETEAGGPAVASRRLLYARTFAIRCLFRGPIRSIDLSFERTRLVALD